MYRKGEITFLPQSSEYCTGLERRAPGCPRRVGACDYISFISTGERHDRSVQTINRIKTMEPISLRIY